MPCSTLVFNGMTVEEGARQALALLAKWIRQGTGRRKGIRSYRDAVAYAVAPTLAGDREWSPASRLHDFCDANMLTFPGDDYAVYKGIDIHPILAEERAGLESGEYREALTDFDNAVMDRVSDLLLCDSRTGATRPPKPAHTPQYWQGVWYKRHVALFGTRQDR